MLRLSNTAHSKAATLSILRQSRSHPPARIAAAPLKHNDVMRSGARRRTAANKPDESVSSQDAKQPESVSSSETNAKHKLDKSGLYDLQQVKRLLDDEVIAFMEDQGYAEATLVSNIKIVAGTLAVIAALYSHFGPGEFPANKPVVFACVAFYLFCMGLINISTFIFEASAVFVGYLTTRTKQVKKPSLAPKIWVLTSFEKKGSSTFRVEIRTAPRRKHDSVSSSHPYEKYITEEGRFLPQLFRANLQELLTTAPASSKKSN